MDSPKFEVLFVEVADANALTDELRSRITVPGVTFNRVEVKDFAVSSVARGSERSSFPRMIDATKAVETADAVVFVVNRDVLNHPALESALHSAESFKKPFLSIALEPLDFVDLPRAIEGARMLTYLEPSQLESVARELIDFLSARVRAREGASDVPAGDLPVGAREVLLAEGESQVATRWVMSENLVRFIRDAARLGNRAKKSGSFPLSFSSLFLALARAKERRPVPFATSELDKLDTSFALERLGLDASQVDQILREPPSPNEQTGPLRMTSSVSNLMRAARKYADRTNSLLDVRHLVGAFAFEPAGHEADLSLARFDRHAWADALIAASSGAEAQIWTEMKSRLPALPPKQQVDVWSVASATLRRTLGWSRAVVDNRVSQLNAPSKVESIIGLDALLAGLLLESAERFDLSAMLVQNMIRPNDATGDAELIWSRLGLRRPTSAQELTALPACTPEVLGVLDVALASKSPDNIELRMSDVFLALFKSGSGGAAPIDALQPSLELDVEGFLDSFLAGAKSAPKPDPREISDVEAILAQRRAAPAWSLPRVDNDSVDGSTVLPDQDRLDARKPAMRFAKLLAAKDVKPPIALGLFGNWGSGKTFFMGLMRSAIRELCTQKNPSYVERAVQIDFNAWHYQDTHLWASLALRIFEKLASELAVHKETTPEARRRELNQRISSSQRQRGEAELRRTQALENRTKAANELTKKRTEREQLLQESIVERLKVAWKTFTSDPEYKDARDTLDKLKTQFGITAALDSAADLAVLRSDVDALRGKTYGVAKAISTRFEGARTIVTTVGVLALVALFALATGFGVERIAQALSVHIPQLSGVVVQVSVLVSAVVGWLSRRVHTVTQAVDMLTSIDKKLAEREKDATSPEIARLTAQIADLDQQIHKASEEVSEAERQIASATAELERINQGGLVYDFLTERQSATAYVGQLGLISTIRRDFEQLGDLLKDFQLFGKQPIERIVLYIDDLDRCQPDKVIEVLQAVHLLIAFDYFNVVVGVDARWLERALWREYVTKFGTPQNGQTIEFSAQDYLEKIFQIPYALSAIDKRGFESLVGDLIQTRSEWRTQKRDEQTKADAERARKAAEAAAADKSASTSDAGASNAQERPAETTDASTASKTTEDKKETAPIPPAADGAALFFEDHEERFVMRLYAFVDRPRLAKRFINIYRLLRVRAEDEGESVLLAGSPNSPEYRAALILLAINVGHPRVAASVMRAVGRADPKRTWPQVLADLASAESVDAEISSAEQRALVREIELIQQRLRDLGNDVPAELDAYKRWAPRVGSFSFDWHRAPLYDAKPCAPLNAPAADAPKIPRR